MPYINVNLKQSISDAQKYEIMKGFGQTIQLIPGKKEHGLMVQVKDGCSLYFRGKEMDKIAYVYVSAYKQASLEHNTLFVEASNTLLSEILDMPVENIYFNITEREFWGTDGSII
jgi:hypothetical protein